MNGARAVIVFAGLALCAVPVAAQQRGAAPAPAPTRTCNVYVDSVGGLANFVRTPRGELLFAGGGVWARCLAEPTTMRSDSVAWFQETGELRLIGRVHFEDSTSVLDADHLTYWVRQERLVAVGNVHTRNTRTGSALRGPNMDYLRAAPGIRDTVELTATGRPTILFYPRRDAARPDSAPPFVVVADRVRMRGNEQMWGGGRVTLDRDALTGRGDSAALDLGADHGYLTGHPVLADTGDGNYRLTGQRIAFDLTSDDDIRRVVSQDSADGTGPDWVLSGDTLDMLVDSGKVQQAQAWGRVRRATAVSGPNTIRADSLDIRMPGQVMRLVWAFGGGRAVSLPDSSAPDSEPDWLSGDTLRARFAERPVGADSAARRGSDIESITAFGSARAYYHIDNEQEPAGPRGISYARGRRIDIALRDSKVRTVDIVGMVDGIYLEPIRTVASDTTAADTTVVRPPPPTPELRR